MADKRSPIHLTAERYLLALRRQRDRIMAGLRLRMVDDTSIGNKHTETSWGLCTTDWPAEDLFHKNAPFLGSKYRQAGQKCPFDTGVGRDVYGCFYRCRIFQGPRPTQAEAVELYDITIARSNPN